MHAYRTHTCGALRAADTGKTVRLSGWIHRKRDHGGLIFIDLRDHYGLTQLVLAPTTPGFDLVDHLRAESVIRVDGEVVARSAETINANLPTGEVEVKVKDVAVLSEAAELPLPVFGEPDYPEEIRLKNRHLDLRRETLHKNIVLRSKVIQSIRNRMIAQDFLEFQTPILTASSPEGARDFLVPSRLHPTKFYALPQAPQQFKQLLMVSGFDRYFQIAPCFRDEDLRADRSLEFYQLDVEMAYVTQEDVFAAIEPVMHGVFTEFGEGKPVTAYPFPRIPYREAIAKYGSDKPDLRNPIVMQDVSAHFVGGGFGLFARILEDKKNAVWAIPAKTGGSRAFCDRMNNWAQGEGQPGLGYIFWSEDQGGWGGPIAKNLGPEKTDALMGSLGLGQGDAAFFVAGDPKVFYKFAGAARIKAGTDLKLVDEDRFEFVWIVDFPMFEMNEETNHVDFSHNPFSMPQGELEALNSKDPLDILAYQYDIVCNGHELCSGAIRNHRPDIMVRAFEIAGYPASTVEEEFGGMLNAFRHGAPPHGGLAPGIDRIVMLLAGQNAIREVIAFPLNQQGQDLMMNAPSEVQDKQLKELHIRLAPPIKV
ncbi:MAG: aspartate--tRNA ligase [Phenylobacterium sp.]|uniref:aspartate--tRNA ligase n=1 Tax=Phenylobacterium sp. TaxID=1871053 RepID=UPI001A5E3565|nr:aspartate--tRNA ligase [Phenylobacterium sp.]MBL8553065.1 aspartate--tRNA ligase [Phenylobacterium sp.]